MPSESGLELVVYGLRNCDSCRRALKWLDSRGVPHRFHDFRLDGLPPDELHRWLASSHADSLLNRRSTTWRQLEPDLRRAAGEAPFDLLLQHPTLIKRPVVTVAGEIKCVGFSESCLEEVA